jgi:hypothetical protein
MSKKALLSRLDFNHACIECIDYMPSFNSADEAGYIIHLKSGFSFDPCSNDFTRFIPLDDISEADNLIIFIRKI